MRFPIGTATRARRADFMTPWCGDVQASPPTKIPAESPAVPAQKNLTPGPRAPLAPTYTVRSADGTRTPAATFAQACHVATALQHSTGLPHTVRQTLAGIRPIGGK